MKTNKHLNQVADIAIQRRSFLQMITVGAAVVSVPTLLTSCTTKGGATTVAGAVRPIDGVIPKYIPLSFVKPDFPSVKGSAPGFLTLPKKLVKSVAKPPGSGVTHKVMTPLWGTIPPNEGNKYFEAVNGLLGSKIEFQIVDGNTYGAKLATVLASPRDVPEWVCVPGWNMPPRFGSEIVDNVFEDLTPFLAGDKVKAYPNLANIPSAAWKVCVWNGKLYALPQPNGTNVGNPLFYRNDLLDAKGITPDVKNGDDLLALAKELTDVKAGRWGTDDLSLYSKIMYGVSTWKLKGGKLVHQFETEEFRAALAWNAKLFASGAVHPDAIAGAGGTRFQSGKVLMACEGWGAWSETLRDNFVQNPSFSQLPLPPFAADGGKPVLFRDGAVGIYSFLKKNDDKAKITELLKLANVLAAPFGTIENDVISNGVEGVHYTKNSAGLPVPTPLAAKELQPTYVFLVAPSPVEAHVQYPGYVKAASLWQSDAGQYLVEPLFYGLQISEPQRFGSLSKPFDDLEKDIARGRKTFKDFDAAVKTWRASGGDELRAFYQKILDAQ